MKSSHGAHNRSFASKIRQGFSERGVSMKSVIAFVVFGMIVLVFVLSDINSRGSGGVRMGSAAEVNGQIISIKDFQEEENRLGQYYSQLFGGQFDMSTQRNMLRGEVMNSLVTKVVTYQAAEKEGIYATDAEVRHTITQELPYFKREGVFQTDAYKSVLNANRLTPGEFERKLRQDIVSQRSRQLFDASVAVTDLQKIAESDLKSTKLNIEYVQFNKDEFAKTHDVSGDVVTKRLADPEFAKKVSDYFAKNKAQFETPEQVKAAHILIRAGQDEKSVKAAQTKAEGILARVQKEDFGKVAAQVSDDPGSKSKNGDLGLFSRGRMMKEFEDAAFNLAPGKTSGLVKTSYGFHIIKVSDKKAATTATLENSRNEIAKRLIAEERYSDVIKSLETALAAGKTDEAVNLVSQNKLAWKETGFFDLSTEALPTINSVQGMRMALELSKTNPVAKRLVREGDSQYFLRFKDMNSAAAPALATADTEALSRQKSSEAFRQWIDSHRKTSKIEMNTQLLQPDAI